MCSILIWENSSSTFHHFKNNTYGKLNIVKSQGFVKIGFMTTTTKYLLRTYHIIRGSG